MYEEERQGFVMGYSQGVPPAAAWGLPPQTVSAQLGEAPPLSEIAKELRGSLRSLLAGLHGLSGGPMPMKETDSPIEGATGVLQECLSISRVLQIQVEELHRRIGVL